MTRENKIKIQFIWKHPTLELQTKQKGKIQQPKIRFGKTRTKVKLD